MKAINYFKMLQLETLSEQLCKTLCSTVKVERKGERIALSIPMTSRDGDQFSVYLEETAGGVRLTDHGTTMMRLSYENDIDNMLDGNRGKVLYQIIDESELHFADGEIYAETSVDHIVPTLFQLGQGLTRISDLGLWNRTRIESTFYEDLNSVITSIVPREKVHRNYTVPGIANAGNYPIDWYIETSGKPLYLFGIPAQDKARLATIILQHLEKCQVDYDSIVICQNFEQLPRKDVSRLMDAANDMVSSIDSEEVIRRKLLKKVLV